MKLANFLSVAAFAITFGVGAANAHTISIGFTAGTNPGEATFWVGNYTHGTPGNVPNEGSISLVGVEGTSFGPVTSLFDINTLSKPTGLTDGTNNFYVSGRLNGTGVLVDTINPFLTVCSACGVVTAWQGKTISGLNPGKYQFSFIEQSNPTADWTQWNGSLNETLTITGSEIGGGGTNVGGGGINVVPLPAGSWLMLAGIGALAGFRFKRKSA